MYLIYKKMSQKICSERVSKCNVPTVSVCIEPQQRRIHKVSQAHTVTYLKKNN